MSVSCLTERQYLDLLPKTIPPEELNNIRLLVNTPVPANGLRLEDLAHAIGHGVEDVTRMILAGGEISHVECRVTYNSKGRQALSVIYHVRQRPLAVWLDGREPHDPTV
jgi:hypothetical protein